MYSIKEEQTGKKIAFRLRDEQKVVARHLQEKPNVPLYIIKSRRLGMSTLLGLFMADQAFWNSGFKGSLIDQTQADAHRKMVDIMRFGILSLDNSILENVIFPKKNDGEMTILANGQEDTELSTLSAGMNARGGTTNMLWVSEWGPIAATDITRSREIRTGALPSARQGRRVVETTWYGGKGGDLWELIKPILEKDPNAEGVVYFFPWHGDPACVRKEGQVTPELESYFRELGDRTGGTFSEEQKKWYAARKFEQGIFVKREYPSTLDEAMESPVEGAIYGKAITELREKGRIAPGEVDKTALVHSFWDLGSPKNTMVWYVQFVANEVRVVDLDYGFDGTLTERISFMKNKPYPLGTCFLPHDAGATKTSGRSFEGEMREAGMHNLKIVPRTRDIWIGINRLNQMFPRLSFRTPQCSEGIDALENYHTRPVSNGAVNSSEPVHDWSSHAADALRVMAESVLHGMVEGGSREALQGRRNSPNHGARVVMGLSSESGGRARI